jgi:hypothetical protein
MATHTEIKEKLRAVVASNPNYPIRAIVTAIDGQTCSAKVIGGLVLSNIRLKATINPGTNYLLMTPQIGSDILLISGDGTLNDLTVIKVDQVQKVEIRQGGLLVLFDSSDSKVSIKNNDTSLKDIFSDLGRLLKQLKVSTPAGPSGTPLPDSIAAITSLETKFNKLLK